MTPIGELARKIMAEARSRLAKRERGDHPGQPLELIPGMPAAPEPCCLAGGKWSPQSHPKDAIAQLKVNGIRCIYMQRKVITRQAQPFDAALHCLPALAALEQRFGEPMVIDGEYHNQTFEKTMSEFKSGFGEGIFWIFDAVPYSEWAANKFTQPLEQRLERIASVYDIEEPFLGMVDGWHVDHAQALQSALSVWEKGHEGLVVKPAKSLYYRGRTKDWQKLKQTLVEQGKIVDAVVEDGQCKTVMVRLESGIVKVSAMSNELRERIGRDPFNHQGDKVALSFNDKNERGKLQGGKVVGFI